MAELRNVLINATNMELMEVLPDNYVDSVVTDPPYELGFMGKKWDSSGIAYNIEMWKECLRVLKPGGYLLAFGGTRTYHRMTCAIEDAGFEIRDCIQWLYGSGFPKSLDIGKAVDKRGGRSVGWFGEWLRSWRKENSINQKELAKLFPSKTGGLTGCVANWELGLNMPTNEQFNLICNTFGLPFSNLEEAKREVVGRGKAGLTAGTIANFSGQKEFDITKGHSEFEGWGTALKPANEPIVVARKPLSEKTVAENVLKWGTGGINIDGCRIAADKDAKVRIRKAGSEFGQNSEWNAHNNIDTIYDPTQGRFPANVILDEEAAAMLDEQSGVSKGNSASRTNKGTGNTCYGNYKTIKTQNDIWGDSGGASRFFYVAKASQKERNMGLEDFPDTLLARSGGAQQAEKNGEEEYLQDHIGLNRITKVKNNHPTVKPVKLMEYLVRLVTPPGGLCFDPFCGSGTTAMACVTQGFDYLGCDMDEHYIKIAEARVAAAKKETR